MDRHPRNKIDLTKGKGTEYSHRVSRVCELMLLRSAGVDDVVNEWMFQRVDKTLLRKYIMQVLTLLQEAK